MKTSNMRHETRDAVLVAIALDMISRTSMSQDGFAEQLNYCLFDMAPARCEEQGYPDLQAMTKTADHMTYARTFKAWSKRVERWLHPHGDGVGIQAWIEEAWVQALPQPWRERCLIELAGRYGLLAVRPIADHHGDALAVFADISRTFGRVAGIGGEVFADGVMNHLDASHAGDYAAYCRKLAAAATAMADKADQIKSTAH